MLNSRQYPGRLYRARVLGMRYQTVGTRVDCWPQGPHHCEGCLSRISSTICHKCIPSLLVKYVIEDSMEREAQRILDDCIVTVADATAPWKTAAVAEVERVNANKNRAEAVQRELQELQLRVKRL
eukprot:5628006-Pyramimonas_sp.AAC.1